MKPESISKYPPDEQTELSDSTFSQSICSATDCTGLIPALPESEAELEAYEEMYQFCFTEPEKKETALQD